MEIWLDAVEDRGRDRDVAFDREAVTDRADVMVDAKNFLDDDHRGFRQGGGIGTVAAELKFIRCG